MSDEIWDLYDFVCEYIAQAKELVVDSHCTPESIETFINFHEHHPLSGTYEASEALLKLHHSLRISGLPRVGGRCGSSYHLAIINCLDHIVWKLEAALQLRGPKDKKIRQQLLAHREQVEQWRDDCEHLDFEEMLAFAEVEYAEMRRLERMPPFNAGQPDDEADDENDAPHTPMQVAILKALDGKCLKKDDLANAVKCDPSSFYRSGGLQELRDRRLVKHKKGCGFYRPDKPPADATSLPPKRD
jgi:hypothetical protein